MGTQKDLISGLIANGFLKSERVKQVLLEVDRGDFIGSAPYLDMPQSIGYGATISAPHMHCVSLELLEPKIQSSSRILDVGSGSGYLTACFTKMIGDNGKIIGIDHIQELIDLSKTNVRKHNAHLLDSGKIEFITGDGRQGYSQWAPYDVIHVGAAAEKLPQALIDQLAVGGRMVIPEGKFGSQEFLQIDKISDTEIRKKRIFSVTYVPLTTRQEQLYNR